MANEEIDFVEVDVEEIELNTLDDITPAYIRSPKVGDKINLVLKGFKIVKDKNELEFSFEKNGKQKTATNALSSVDYGIQLHTTEKQIFWVNSWAVWGQLKAIATKLNSNSMNGLEIQIDHPHNGMLEEFRDKCWVVRAKVDNEWKVLGRESKEWE